MIACAYTFVHGFCALQLLVGVFFLLRQLQRGPSPYGRYTRTPVRTVPARWAWFLQEMPSLLVPALMACTTDGSAHGRTLLLCTFTLHYLHRTLFYSLLIRGGKPVPVFIVVSASLFCLLNGFLQSHALLHCSARGLDQDQDQGRGRDQGRGWVYSLRTGAGLGLFAFGMIMNIHSDHILRNLRKPGETSYKIPRGGLFELVSGANFSCEILEWFGFAVTVWNLAGFSFFFFSLCSIGPRAFGHHRFYLQKFPDYPRNRKALIPFLL
ncbi:3-oxo-5-alpha-steroid 4-dehydrogenase 2-like [Eucyclogobius newberryi]|uniref:3-oxo-5-alpha-steroid 4-dehydrogenase 2-like n=1 Tax=Eucyclogobius newberryi TaxID=166745 RepID=UPI003B5AD539